MTGLCGICPRKCGADRRLQDGFCGMGDHPVVARACLHMWEEPCISGTRGSGTVFFSGCNLKCVYCQNHRISHEGFGKELTVEELASVFLSLQRKGAHNINLVTPAHFAARIREALGAAAGLKLPVVYNSGGYESLDGLKIMEGIADVYLPDLKYFSPDISRKYSGAADYFQYASGAVLEMYRQVGPPEFDSEGILRRGLMIRHLILPGLTGESVKLLQWIRENLPGGIYISLMSQYTPCYRACEFPQLNRRITRREYEKVLDCFYKLGFENGYIQERASASEEYIPEFNLEGVE
jgi:putative pyruvate formate lyase activating enzyme